jgi:hypothetical protein
LPNRRPLLALAGLAAVLALASLVVMSGASPHARKAPATTQGTRPSAVGADSDAGPARALAFVQSPLLPLGVLDPGQARELNAVTSPAPLTGVAPVFVLTASAPERARATLCMAQAIYYEAALEPVEGQQAVAQTILNRVRHPNFPKSVCGVVYEGARAPGCEFSFACDGSRERPPIEPYWSRAMAVARAALDGYVDKSAGAATYYHADYIYPPWAPQLVKIGQFGSQLFYRYPGPLGAVEALTGRYRGGELKVSTTGPPASVILAMRNGGALTTPAPATGITIAAQPVVDASGVLRSRVAGQIVFGRRIPSKEEIAQVNAEIDAAPADDRKMRIDDLTADTPAPQPAASAAAPTPTGE